MAWNTSQHTSYSRTTWRTCFVAFESGGVSTITQMHTNLLAHIRPWCTTTKSKIWRMQIVDMTLFRFCVYLVQKKKKPAQVIWKFSFWRQISVENSISQMFIYSFLFCERCCGLHKWLSTSLWNWRRDTLSVQLASAVLKIRTANLCCLTQSQKASWRHPLRICWIYSWKLKYISAIMRRRCCLQPSYRPFSKNLFKATLGIMTCHLEEFATVVNTKKI